MHPLYPYRPVLPYQSQALKLLLDHGANVNAGDGEGLTPLHYAALASKREVRAACADPGLLLLSCPGQSMAVRS